MKKTAIIFGVRNVPICTYIGRPGVECAFKSSPREVGAFCGYQSENGLFCQNGETIHEQWAQNLDREVLEEVE